MKKNGSKKRISKKPKRAVQKKSKKSTIKKTNKKPNTGKFKNVRSSKKSSSKKQPLKKIVKGRKLTILNDLISDNVKVSSTGKVRINDKNGRIKWVYFTDYKKSVQKIESEKLKKTFKKISKKSVVSTKFKSEYEKITSLSKLKSFLKKNKIKYSGREISKQAEAEILKFAQMLDNDNIKWNLQEMLDKEPHINKKVLVVSDRADNNPKYQFHWSIYNNFKYDNFGQNINILIRDFNGNIAYKGNDNEEAEIVANSFNQKLDELEKEIKDDGGDSPYFTVAVYETKIDGNIVDIEINFASVESRLPREEHAKYINKL